MRPDAGDVIICLDFPEAGILVLYRGEKQKRSRYRAEAMGGPRSVAAGTKAEAKTSRSRADDRRQNEELGNPERTPARTQQRIVAFAETAKFQ